jgi:hypothetical protein
VRRLYACGESTHGFSRVLLGEAYEEIRVADLKVTFHPTISPRQAEYCDRTRTRGTVGVAVESAVQKHISRLDIDSAAKTSFDKGTGENNACITVTMQMTRRCLAARKHLKSGVSRFVFELPPHA